MKLKNLFFCITMFVFIASFMSCSTHGQVKLLKDDFRDATTISMELHNLYSEKKGFFDDEYVGFLTFHRDFIQDKKKDVEVSFKIRSKEDSEKLTNIMFMKIGDKKIEFVLTNRTAENKSITRVDDTIEADASSDGSDDEVSTKTKVKVKRQTHTMRWKELKGKITLGNDIDEQILTCNKLTLRLYSGKKPITFIIEDKDLTHIKKFIKTEPENKTEE